ncbi:GFA family protein [Tropicimonas sp. IMCC6043]|uniref:GFA family protein n=1 Tax=Tropicimonas sp. IMCC6043 TaxID=2510645 RepID=UPI00101E2241|nr:GFA family protein [Tropicimonas sp. IMCC6043]RYH09964.1 GFA family protein [Tropicimonas sp. IMCC6043]
MKGQCLCGAVTLEVTPEAREVSACHCRMCRLWTGAALFVFTAAPEQVSVAGPVRRFRSSEFATRAFCETCGSHLWIQDDGGDYELLPGLFEEAASFALTSEIYVDHRLGSAELCGDHPRRTRAEYESQNPFVEEERLQ